MSIPGEGSQVCYVGDPARGLDVGDQGRVLATSGQASHVMWASGSRTRQVDLVHHDDLVVAGRATPAVSAESCLEDSLSLPTISMVAVRDTFEAQGEAGLLNALSDAGHLAALSDAAEEALSLVASRVRADEGFAAVLGQLDPEEGDLLVGLTAAVLLRDSFSTLDPEVASDA